MANTTLIKSTLRNSIAEGIYNEITNRNSRYFYFLGKTLTWDDELSPLIPVDSVAYSSIVRNDIITVKEISPTDVAFVVPRYEWVEGGIYDQYDDQYSTEIQGINLTAGGSEFTTIPSVYIGSEGYINFAPITVYTIGQLLKSGSNYYVVSAIDISVVTGTSGIAAPTHTSGTVENGTVFLKYVVVSDGNGSGATAVVSLTDGVITSIDMTNRGIGYTSEPTVIIIGEGNVTEPVATTVITKGPNSLKQKIEDCAFYAITDEHNVYICLDNNNGGQSFNKPVDTDPDPIVYPDGYTWKFLYNVPIGLRNKFLTNTYIPVITSIQNQFYSNGNIQVVRVDQAGLGYTAANISVIGDGYLAANPIYITALAVTNGGSGYVTPTIIIAEPFLNVIPWSANLVVVTGQKYSYLNNIYEVVVSGEFGVYVPIHKYETVSNGTAALKYVGTRATANITESGGIIDSITLNKDIREVNIKFAKNGSGYISPPPVTFIGGSGTGASAVAIVSNTAISRIIVTDAGENYLSIPDVVIGTEWTASTVVLSQTQLFFGDYLYTVTNPGTTGIVAPTHTSGTVVDGTATLTYVGLAAQAECTLKAGAGYSYNPIITISGGAGANAKAQFATVKSEAKLIPILDNGQLSHVQIDDGGVGYTYATLTISGDGTGALASAQLSIGDANTIQSNVELLTVDGTINNIPVISQGFGYSSATITITGDGTGATAIAHVSGGAIQKIEITNPGKNYRWATASISGIGVNVTYGGTKYKEIPTVKFSDPIGDGAGTTATAVISGGAVTEVNIVTAGSAYTTAPTVTIGSPYITFDGNTAVNIATNSIHYVGQLFQTGDKVKYSTGGGTAIASSIVTFNSITDVSTSTHQIHMVAHPFITGDQVKYDSGSGIAIGGLTDESLYYVIKIDNDHIKLAASYYNSIVGDPTPIAILAGGAVTSIPVVGGGTGYASATVTVTGTGTGASGVAVINPTTGTITSITVTGGSGYTASPSVSLVAPANPTPTGTGLGPITKTCTGTAGVNTIVVPPLTTTGTGLAPIVTTGTGTYNTTSIVVADYTGIVAGMLVTGVGIAAGTKVLVTPITTTVVLDTPHIGAVSGTLNFLSRTIVVAAYVGLTAGMPVSGTGIAVGAKVLVTPISTTVTLDLPHTSAVSGTINFYNIAKDMLVIGAGISAGTRVTATPTTTTVTLSATNSNTVGLPTVTPTATGYGASTVDVDSFAGIVAGMNVSGTGIETGARVLTTPTTTTVTLDTPNSGVVSGTITFDSILTFASTAIVVSSKTGIVAGMNVSGTGIASGTKVLTTPTTTTVVLDKANTNDVSGTITFSPTAATLGTAVVTSNVVQSATYILNSNQNYYVISTTDTIQLSKVLSGSAIDFTAVGSGATQKLTLDGGAALALSVLTPDAIGYGAKLRTIVSPYGGHGKEALNNLFAKTLMFYTNIAADKNQGFTVNNDYRQIGILKNPRQYGSTYTLTNNLTSACWVLSSSNTIDPILFPLDSVIYLNYALPDQTRFRVVSNAGLSILVQSIDNGMPELGATFVNSFSNGRGSSFVASTVTPPTMDKYSGDLLFIDNKQAFTPSAEQIVSIRTVLKF